MKEKDERPGRSQTFSKRMRFNTSGRMHVAKDSKTKPGRTAAKRRAIFFELETVAVAGRNALYEATKSAMKDKGVEMAPVDFSRFILDHPLAEGLARLLKNKGGKKNSAKSLATKIMADINLWAGSGLEMHPVLAQWIGKQEEQRLSFGAACGWGPDLAEALDTALSLKEKGVLVSSLPMEDAGAPHAEVWLGLARQAKVPPPLCVVLATSMHAAKAAIAVGMRTVAIEDDFNAFQDFSGSDCVTETLNNDTLVGALALMNQHFTRAA